MRAFIALELPEEIKKEIREIQSQLKNAGVQATWVKPEITHLTIAFLGSVTHKQLEIIHQILEGVVPSSLRFRLGLINFFPNPARPRIIFLDFEGDLEKLKNLVSQLRQQLKKEKIWFDDKPFVAHITLGRIKKRQNLTQVLKGIKIKKIEFLSNEITFNQSELGSLGPIYTRLETITFS